MKLLMLLGLALGATTFSAPATATNDSEADKLVRKSKCLTCHRVNRKKDGPSFKETAIKYREKDQAHAQEELTRWVTEERKVEVDGEQEKHGILKSTNPAEVSNVVQWILTR